MKIIENGKTKIYVSALCALLSVGVVCLTTTACSTGGYKLARAYSKWLHSQGTFLRIVLYLTITAPVIIVAFVVDTLIFNVVDFWTGTVSAKNEVIEKDGMRVMIAHSRTPLRKSVITMIPKEGATSVIELRETAQHSVEVYRDGVKKAEMENIDAAVSSLAIYDDQGLAPIKTVTLAASDFDHLEALPASEGIMDVTSRLGLQSSVQVCSQ